MVNMSTTGNIIRWDASEAGTTYGVTTDEQITVEITYPQLGQNHWLINIANRDAKCLYAGVMAARWSDDLDVAQREAVVLVNRAARGLL